MYPTSSSSNIKALTLPVAILVSTLLLASGLISSYLVSAQGNTTVPQAITTTDYQQKNGNQYDDSGGDVQSSSEYINGVVLSSGSTRDGWTTYRFLLPSTATSFSWLRAGFFGKDTSSWLGNGPDLKVYNWQTSIWDTWAQPKDEGFHSVTLDSTIGKYINSSNHQVSVRVYAGRLDATHVDYVKVNYTYSTPTYGNLSGYVTDRETGTPIISAQVELVGVDTKYTDYTGYYSFGNVLTGDYTLRVSADGYHDSGNLPVTIGEGNNAKNVTLQPLPAPPDIDVSPSSLAFPDTIVGQSSTKPLTIYNRGVSTLAVQSITFSGSPDFSLDNPPSFPFTILGGSSRTLNVRFRPSSEGAKSGTLTVNSDDPDEPSIQVPLTGSGYVPRGNLSGYVTDRETETAIIGAQVELVGVDTKYTDYTGYYSFGNVLTGNYILRVSADGYHDSGNLPVTIGEGNNAKNVTLQPLPDPQDIDVSPSSLAFPDTIVGQSSTKSLTLYNRGILTLVVQSITFSGSSDFSLDNPPSFPFTILGGSSRTLNVRFRPSSEGAKSGTLTVNSDDPDEPSVQIPLTGSGYVPRGNLSGYVTDRETETAIIGARVELVGVDTKYTDYTGYYSFGNVLTGDYTLRVSADGYHDSGDLPVTIGEGDNTKNVTLQPLPDPQDIDVSPSSLAFPDTIVGQSSTKSLTLYNRGVLTLVVQSITFSGSPDFSLDNPPSFPFTILGGDSRTLNVRFRPSTEGAKSGALTINSDDPDEPSIQVPLTGSAVPASTVAATAGPDQTARVNELVILNGLQSTGSNLSYRWTQLAGPQSVVIQDNTKVQARYRSPVAGVYAFRLEVTDGIDTDSDTVNVTVGFPVAVIAPVEPAPRVGDWVTLDGSSSYDPLGRPLQYQWHQINGPPVALNGAATATSSFQLNSAGPYEFDLIVWVEINGQRLEGAPATVVVQAASEGTIKGHVYVDANRDGAYTAGEGVEGATVSTDDGAYSAGSLADGSYSLAVPAGTYTVLASHPDYNQHRRPDITVDPAQTTTADIAFSTGDCRTVGVVRVCADDFVPDPSGGERGTTNIGIGSWVSIQGDVVVNAVTPSITGIGDVYFLVGGRGYRLYSGAYSINTSNGWLSMEDTPGPFLEELLDFIDFPLDDTEGLPDITLDTGGTLTITNAVLQLQIAGNDIQADVQELVIDAQGNVSGRLSLSVALQVYDMDLNVTRAEFSNDGIVLDGDLMLPSSLGGGTVSVTNLVLTSSGLAVTSIHLAGITFDIGGMAARIDSASISDEGIRATGVLTPPLDITSETIAFTDIVITANGIEGGQVDMDNLSVDVGPAALVLFDASIVMVDTNQAAVRVARAELTLNGDLGGGQAWVEDLIIDSDGAHFREGEATLPPITFGQIKIKNTRVYIQRRDAGGYAFEGGGTLVVDKLAPGSADTSITVYVRVYLDAEQVKFERGELGISGPRVPLGTTGFFITGLHGVIDWSTPDSGQIDLQITIEGGPRVKDIVALSGDVGTTINLSGWLRLYGDMKLFTYEVTEVDLSLNQPGISDNGLRGSLHLDVFAVFVGNATIYVYRDGSGELAIEGSAEVLVQLPLSELPDWVQDIVGEQQNIRLGQATATLGKFRGAYGVSGKGTVFAPWDDAKGLLTLSIFVSAEGDVEVGLDWINPFAVASPHVYKAERGVMLPPATRAYFADEARQYASVLGLNPGTEAVAFSLDATQAPHLIFSLLDPANNPINESNVDSYPNITLGRRPGRWTYLVQQPIAGDWNTVVDGIQGDEVYTETTVLKNSAPTVEIVSIDSQAGKTGAKLLSGPAHEIAWTIADPDDTARVSLYYDDNSQGYDGTLIAANLLPTDSPYFWDVGELRTGTYYIYAKAEDDKNPPSYHYFLDAPVEIINTTAPLTPAGVEARAGVDTVVVEWAANTEPDLAGYVVHYGTAGGSLNNAITTTLPSATVPRLDPIQPLHIAVEAFDTSGNHSASLSEEVVIIAGQVDDAIAPGVPMTPTVSIVGDMVHISWQEAPADGDLAGYLVYYDYKKGAPYQGTEASDGPSPIEVGSAANCDLTSLSCDLTGLEFGRSLYIAITAYDTAGNESDYSEEVQLRLKHDPVPDEDGDGLDDDYERAYWGDTASVGPTDDTDGDWLGESEEYGSFTNPRDRDTDADGYWDGDEVASGTNPLRPDSHPTLTVGTITLPDAQVGVAYQQTLMTTVGSPPYAWSHAGHLPEGLTLGEDGKISGIPTAEGDYRLAVRVSDDSGEFDSQRLTLHISPGSVEQASLTVTVKNVDGGLAGIPGNNGSVKLYGSDGTLVAEKPTTDAGNGDGQATFNNLEAGTYYCEVYHDGGIWGREYWGRSATFSLNPGENRIDTFYRYMPWVSNVEVIDQATGQVIGSPVPPGQQLQLEIRVTVRNDSTADLPVKVTGYLDHTQSPPYDYSGTSGSQVIPGQSSQVFNLPIAFTPDVPNTTYYAAYEVVTDVNGTWQRTDSGDWYPAFDVGGSTCYTLTVMEDGNGSVPAASPAKSAVCDQTGYYEAGETITLSGATPDPGWHIARWSGTDNDASTASSNAVTMPASDHTAKVIYEQDTPEPGLILEDDFSTAKAWVDNSGGYFSRDETNEWLNWHVRRDTFQLYYIPITSIGENITFRYRIRANYWANNNHIDVGLAETLDGAYGGSGNPTGMFVRMGWFGGGTSDIERYIAPYGIYTDQPGWSVYRWPNQPDTYVGYAEDTWYQVEMTLSGLEWTLSVYEDDGATLRGQLSGTMSAAHTEYNYFMIMNTGLGDWPTGDGWLDNIQVYGGTAIETIMSDALLVEHLASGATVDVAGIVANPNYGAVNQSGFAVWEKALSDVYGGSASDFSTLNVTIRYAISPNGDLYVGSVGSPSESLAVLIGYNKWWGPEVSLRNILLYRLLRLEYESLQRDGYTTSGLGLGGPVDIWNKYGETIHVLYSLLAMATTYNSEYNACPECFDIWDPSGPGPTSYTGDTWRKLDLSYSGNTHSFIYSRVYNDNGNSTYMKHDGVVVASRGTTIGADDDVRLDEHPVSIEMGGHRTWSELDASLHAIVVGGTISSSNHAEYPANGGNPVPSVLTIPPRGEVAPVAQIDSIAPNPAQPAQPPDDDIITFAGSGEDPDGGAIQAYDWASDVDGPLSDQASFTKSAYEMTVGTHSISLQVQDDEGVWSSVPDTEPIEVLNALPTVNILSPGPVQPMIVLPGELVVIEFEAYDNDELRQSIVAYRIWFDDGDWITGPFVTTGQTVTYTFVVPPDIVPGLYQLCVAVQDDEWAWGEQKCVSIQYPYPPPDHQVTVDTNPRVAGVTVDGQVYLPDALPRAFTWPAGSEHNLAVEATVAGDSGIRYVFTQWSDGNTSPIRDIAITGGAYYTATYKTQHYLTVTTNPSGLADIAGSGWYDSGSTTTAGPAPDTVGSCTFTGWTVDGTPASGNPVDVSMDAPHTATADYQCGDVAQLYLDPSSTTAMVGQIFTIGIKVDTGPATADTVDAYIDFDPTYLEVVDEFGVPAGRIELNTAVFSSATFNAVDNATGHIDFSASRYDSPLSGGPFTAATIRFKAKAEVDITSLTFVRSGARWSDLLRASESLTPTITDGSVSITSGMMLNGFVTLERRGDPGDPRWMTELHRMTGDTKLGGIQVYEAGTTNLLGTFSATTDADGRFSVALASIEPGTYDIRVKGSNTLSNKKSNISLPSDTETDFGTLLVGDSNGDDAVNGADVSYMIPSFLLCSSAPEFRRYGDTNKDGCINGADVSALIPNFLEAGPIAATGPQARESASQSTIRSPQFAVPDSVTLSLHPSNQSAQIGDIFTLDIVANTGTGTADTVDAYIDFDPTYLEVVDALGMPATTIESNADIFDFITVNAVDNATGQVNFSASKLGSSLTDAFAVATIRFRVKSAVEVTDVVFVRSGARMSDLYQSGEPLEVALANSTVTNSTKAEVYLPLVRTNGEGNR